MRKSFFSEFFYICATILSCAIICIATCLLLVSANFYKREQKDTMYVATQDALAVTMLNINSNDGVSTNFLRNAYLNIADTTNIDFALADENGHALVCSEAPPCSHVGKNYSATILNKITENGFFEISSLDNFYSDSYFNLAYKISENGESYYLFAKLPLDSLREYLSKLLIIIFFVAVLTLILSFLALYISMKRLLTPIGLMTAYAKKFGEGDFTEKIFITDENELGYLANTLNEMASSLETIDENRKSFVSNVSHELRTPMTTIGGFVDGILDGTIPPEKHKHYLRIVSDEIDRLARLVRSMLNISKYEAGELSLQTETFDLMPIVLRTCFLFEKRIEAKGIEIIGIDNPNFVINADADLIQQVIYNLVENAVKFVNRDGYIKFSFSYSSKGQPVVTIRNSGAGLKITEIKKVFDRFYKSDESRGIDKTGVGLGLSIVRSIVKLHNGRILVRSEPEQYAEFEFSLNDDSYSNEK